jgi:hypothetical protein
MEVPRRPQRHKGHKEENKGRKRQAQRPSAVCSYLTLFFSLCPLCLCGEDLALPREVGEGLVGFGHFDGVFAFGHGVAFTAVRSH